MTGEFKQKLISQRPFLKKFFSANHLPTQLIHSATPAQIDLLGLIICKIGRGQIPIRQAVVSKLNNTILKKIASYEKLSSLPKEDVLWFAPVFKYLLRPLFYKKRDNAT